MKTRKQRDQDEFELVTAARNGDYGAFEKLVRAYLPRVYRFALRISKDSDDAQAIVAQTFQRAYQGLGGVRQEMSVASWVFRLSVNTALMRLRDKRGKPLLALENVANENMSSTDKGIWPQADWLNNNNSEARDQKLASHVESAADALPEKYELVLLLRDVEGLSNEEVAHALGLTLPTAKSRVHRSRVFVRDHLEAILATH